MAHARELYTVSIVGENRILNTLPYFTPDAVDKIVPPSIYEPAFPPHQPTIYSSQIEPSKMRPHYPVAQETLETFLVTRATQIGVRAPYLQRKQRVVRAKRQSREAIVYKTPDEARQMVIDRYSKRMRKRMETYPHHTWIPLSGNSSLLPPPPPIVFDGPPPEAPHTK